MSKTILVIDDDQDTLDLIEIVLNEEGYNYIEKPFDIAYLCDVIASSLVRTNA